MATLQQSVDIILPHHTVYERLAQFEHYPRLMEDIVAVRQLDNTHLRWKANLAGCAVEWTAEITEQLPHRCIAWRNTSGPENTDRIEVQETGPATTTVILTLTSESRQAFNAEGSGNEDPSQRLTRHLANLKIFLESCGNDSDAWWQGTQTGLVAMQGNGPQELSGDLAEEGHGSGRAQGLPGNSSVPMPGYSARPDVLTTDESQPSPVLSDAIIASTLEKNATALPQFPAEAATDLSEGKDSAQGNAMQHVGQISPVRRRKEMRSRRHRA